MTQYKRKIEYITHYKEHENRTSDDKNEEHKRNRKRHIDRSTILASKRHTHQIITDRDT